ncbi:AraC family transcriptional regulator [Paenibacillus senegalensis]|uniref:AraC family transcriptional regulator n=1 Tax=Paenibacillus senegalensis TaxID=1465766 RepID=UPI0002F35434|nr:AraC family transcriptional regulator [Paenibacillus senegalensis]
MTSVTSIRIYEHKHLGGHRITEHHHPYYQLLFVLEGEGKIRLDGVAHELSIHDTALIAPYCPHSVLSDSKLTLLVVAFERDALDPEIVDGLMREVFADSLVIKMNSFTGSEQRQLLRKMLFEQAAQESLLGRLSLKILLSQFLITLARSVTPVSSGSQAAYVHAPANPLRAEKVRKYLDTHYFEPLTAPDIASKLGISTRHVNNIFKEQYGLTPMQYLTRIRIQVAERLLAETDKSIISICFEVGYDSVSTFYRCFKAETNVSPNTYRKSSTHQET